MNVLDKLLFNLHTIAGVPKGKRIGTTKEFIIIEEESPMQGFWRWKYSDSRDKAASCICREVRTIIVMAQYLLESKYLVGIEATAPPASEGSSRPVQNISAQDFLSERTSRLLNLKKIRLSLIGAAVGVNNICQTYEIDANFAGNLRPLVAEINGCAMMIGIALKQLGESTDLDMISGYV
jgi:hypothetical protein